MLLDVSSSPPGALFADDIVMCSTRREHVERKLEEWSRAMEERGLTIGVVGRLNNWGGAMNITLQRYINRERQ